MKIKINEINPAYVAPHCDVVNIIVRQNCIASSSNTPIQEWIVDEDEL